MFHNSANQGLVVNNSFARNLATKQNHSSFRNGFCKYPLRWSDQHCEQNLTSIRKELTTSYLSIRVLSEMGVEDSVGDHVAHLVGMAFANGLTCEEEVLFRSICKRCVKAVLAKVGDGVL